MQSATNVRGDEYGGSFENRFRLVREVIEAVTAVFPANRVGIRLSPNGVYNSMGSADNFDFFTFVIQELEKLHLGFVHVLDGLAFGAHGKCKIFKLFDAKRFFGGAVIGNCGYVPETAEGAVGTGAADAIAFGRLYLSNPDLVERLEQELPLTDPPPYGAWYRQTGDDQSVNLTDFPSAGEKK
jgi:N-ethylmaleimide reductase